MTKESEKINIDDIGNPIKNPGGAPTKYDPKYCQEMIEYFDIPKTYEREVTNVNKNGEFTTYEIEANPMPQFSKYARNIGVSKQTLLNWTVEFPEFLDAYNVCKDIQKEFIQENGMSGRYNAQFTKFVAINATDMRDKQEIDHKNNGKSFDRPKIIFTKTEGKTHDDRQSDE